MGSLAQGRDSIIYLIGQSINSLINGCVFHQRARKRELVPRGLRLLSKAPECKYEMSLRLSFYLRSIQAGGILWHHRSVCFNLTVMFSITHWWNNLTFSPKTCTGKLTFQEDTPSSSCGFNQPHYMPCFEKHVFGGLLNFLADFIAVIPTHPGTKSSLTLDSLGLFSHPSLFSQFCPHFLLLLPSSFILFLWCTT